MSLSASSVLFDADAEEESLKEKGELREKRDGSSEKDAGSSASASVSARAVDAYLEDDAWEARQRAGARGYRPIPQTMSSKAGRASFSHGKMKEN